MKLEALSEELFSMGWMIESSEMNNHGCGWYGWLGRGDRQTPTNCACNDKPPSFVIEPSSFDLHGVMHSSVTFRLCGELPNGRWVNFSVYSIALDDAIKEIEPSKAVLFASWEAACSASNSLIKGTK